MNTKVQHHIPDSLLVTNVASSKQDSHLVEPGGIYQASYCLNAEKKSQDAPPPPPNKPLPLHLHHPSSTDSLQTKSIGRALFASCLLPSVDNGRGRSWRSWRSWRWSSPLHQNQVSLLRGAQRDLPLVRSTSSSGSCLPAA